MNQPVFENSSSKSIVTTTALYDVESGKFYTSVDSQTKETSETYTNGSSEKYLSSKLIDLQSPTVVAHANKKPSYLNLACCVNGYSNYTNYDSAERKEINKSREASPIPPFTSISRHTVVKKESPSSSLSFTKRFAEFNMQEKDTTDNASSGLRQTPETKKSFIQQRVEKLYGTSNILTNSHNNTHNGSKTNSPVVESKTQDEQTEDSSHALPVMKHLRPEFRNRLTFVSPPKNNQISSYSKHIESPASPEKGKVEKSKDIIVSTTVSEKINLTNTVESVVVPEKPSEHKNGNFENGNSHKTTAAHANVKDGHYFLKLLNDEKTRILSMADVAEQKLEQRQSEVRFNLINFNLKLIVNSRSLHRTMHQCLKKSLDWY